MFSRGGRVSFRYSALLFLLLPVFAGCGSHESPTRPTDDTVFQVEVMKWYNGRRAAVSLTYDALYGQNESQPTFDRTINEVLSRGLRLDFEFGDGSYVIYPTIVADIREKAIPRGIHFFGHGHTHVPHDTLSYEASYLDFKTCFDNMTAWGLKPRVYAYPHYSGRQITTQAANRDAGFIAARGAWTYRDSVYLCPDDRREPDTWHYLASIPVGQIAGLIQTHQEMKPFFFTALEKSAWIIFTFHAIGFPGQYGYYPMADFLADLDLIKGNDFWSANFDDAVCYIKERNMFHLDQTSMGARGDSLIHRIVFRDGLDNTTFDQPLTLQFRFRPDMHVRKVVVQPEINSTREFPVANDMLRINIVPDEKTYLFKLVTR